MADGVNIDWGLLQSPNFAQAALSGYQAGQALGKQKRLDAALQGIDLTKPESLAPVIAADPSTGAALIGASVKLSEAQRDAESRQAMSDVLIANWKAAHRVATSGDTPTPPPAPPTLPTAADPTASSAPASPSSAPTDPGEIVVTANKPAAAPTPDPMQAAEVNLIRRDPEGYMKLQTQLSSMTKAQLEAANAANDKFGGLIESAKDANGNWLPPDQVRAIVNSHRADLIQNGVPAQQIDSFDYSPGSLNAFETEHLGVKGALERQDKARDSAFKEKEFAQKSHHDSVEEGQGAAHVAIAQANNGIAAGNLAVNRGRLNLAQQVAGPGSLSGHTSAELVAIARGQKKPSASDVLSIAGDR